MNSPNTPRIMLNRINCFLVSSFSPTCINCETNMEFINMATNKEEPSTTDNVMGKKIINSPIMPGQVPNGTKAATVVAVDMIMGMAISPIPFLAASLRDMPSCSIRRYTFSTTTTPLSTNIPNPIMRPKRIIVFRVYPIADKIIKDMNMDMGMAKPTNSAFLKPKKNINTVTTSMIPKMMLFTKSSTWFSVLLEESLAMVTSRS